MDENKIYKFLGKHFDAPCGYTFVGGVEGYDIMPDSWCEAHCKEYGEEAVECWRKFFEEQEE